MVRKTLVARYPGLASSDVIDEMVQRAAVEIWEKRRSGRPLNISAQSKWVGAETIREGPRIRSPAARRAGLAGTRYPDNGNTRLADNERLADVHANTASPLDRAATSEFLRALSSEERAIVTALLQCGGRRDMADVAELVGVTRRRVERVLEVLRQTLPGPPLS